VLWCTAVIPALLRYRQEDLDFSHPGLHRDKLVEGREKEREEEEREEKKKRERERKEYTNGQ
jgi:hypothetical protein